MHIAPDHSQTISAVRRPSCLWKMTNGCALLSAYSVLAAGDGASALVTLEENEQPPQILITDIMMPGMSGRELADEVTLRISGIKVLSMSGYTHEGAVQVRPLEKGEAFLQKPFSLSELGQRLRQILGD